MLDIVIII